MSKEQFDDLLDYLLKSKTYHNTNNSEFQPPKYWVIGFNISQAYIIKANKINCLEDITKTDETYIVSKFKLKDKYKLKNEDLKKMAMKRALVRKNDVDPRIIFDASISNQEKIQLYKQAGLKEGAARMFISQIPNLSEEFKQERIKDYDIIQSTPIQELYDEVLNNLEKTINYTPEQIKNFNDPQDLIDLGKRGIIMGLAGFNSLEHALEILNEMWMDYELLFDFDMNNLFCNSKKKNEALTKFNDIKKESTKYMYYKMFDPSV